MKNNEDIRCVCSKCRSFFLFSEAVVKKRKLFNSEIEEKSCPFCGSKAFSPTSEIHWLGQMASKHTHNGNT